MLQHAINYQLLIHKIVENNKVLVLLLFYIYTCIISSYLGYCNVYLYAEDTQLYYTFLPKNCLILQQRIKEDLSRLLKMSNKNYLKINGMLFGKNREVLKTNFKIKIDNGDVVFTSSCKNLMYFFAHSLNSNHT